MVFHNKKFYKNLESFLSLPFPIIRKDGGNSTLNLFQTSMFFSCDPIKLIQNFKSVDVRNPECIKVRYILDKLVTVSKMDNQIVELEKISGVASASDDNWRDLKEYSEFLLPRARWKLPSEKSFYGFETEADFKALENALITGISPYILSVEYLSWSGRHYIFNCNGSHRCAAFYRQNYEQNRNYSFETILNIHSLNKELLKSFLNEYYCVITSYYTANRIKEFFPKLKILSDLIEDNEIKTILIIKKNNTDEEIFLFKILQNMDLRYIFVLNESEYLKSLK